MKGGGKGKAEEGKKGGMEAGAGVGEGTLDLQSLKPEPAASTPGRRKEPPAPLYRQAQRRGSGTGKPGSGWPDGTVGSVELSSHRANHHLGDSLNR